jgi:hypothetical protein
MGRWKADGPTDLDGPTAYPRGWAKERKKERGLMQAERDRERSLGVDFRLFELMIFYLNL